MSQMRTISMSEIGWAYVGNTQLSIDITNRVATITAPNADWNGAETITFKATDPGTLFDQNNAIFTVTAVNDSPVVGDIPNQSIMVGSSFATINLDNYVSDADNTDAEIAWSYSGNIELSVSIVDRVATLNIPTDWTGDETITFTATDPGTLYDEDSATFTVTPAGTATIQGVTYEVNGTLLGEVTITVDGGAQVVSGTDRHLSDHGLPGNSYRGSQ